VRCFALDFTATSTAELIGISVRSVNTIYLKIRSRSAECCELESPLQGAVEVDESYFGAHRVRGKRGRGAYGKTIVFGLLKRQGKVYTEIVTDCSKPTLQGIIRGHVGAGTIIHSDGWRGYDGLVDIGFDKHLESIMARMNLPMWIGILMGLSLFGVMRNDDWQSLTAWSNTR
jgi:transposase